MVAGPTRAANPNMLAAALWYARRGCFVFPLHQPLFAADGRCCGCTCEAWRRTNECRRATPHLHLAPGLRCAGPGKHPRVRWRAQATTDPAAIERWWRAWPQANVGIDCGKSGIVALDADLYKESCAAGLALLDRETVTSITGGGGEHLWYAQPAACRYGNETGDLPPGLDVRGEGGYIVAPPSLHGSGARYCFEFGYALGEVALKPLPQPIRDLIDAGSTGPRRAAGPRCAGPANRYAVQAAEAVVAAAIVRLGLAAEGPGVYDQEGRRWILTTCPFNPPGSPHAPDAAAYIVIARDGHIAAGCHHARCREALRAAGMTGWRWLQRRATA